MVFVAELHWISLSTCMVNKLCFLLVLATDMKKRCKNQIQNQNPQGNRLDIKKDCSCLTISEVTDCTPLRLEPGVMSVQREKLQQV